LETLGKVHDLLRVAGNPSVYVLLNRIEPGARKQFEDAKGMIERTFELQVCPFFLSQYRAYENALETGQTAQELDPNGKTAAELETLYLFVCEHVKKGDREHGQKLTSRA